MSETFERIFKIRYECENVGTVLVKLTSETKNSYQFVLDKKSVEDWYNSQINNNESVSTEDYALKFKDFGYDVEFIESEFTIEI